MAFEKIPAVPKQNLRSYGGMCAASFAAIGELGVKETIRRTG
jgi:hypothetical protein